MLHFHSRHICILSITLWLEKGVHIKLEFKSYYFHFLWFIKLRSLLFSGEMVLVAREPTAVRTTVGRSGRGGRSSTVINWTEINQWTGTPVPWTTPPPSPTTELARSGENPVLVILGPDPAAQGPGPARPLALARGRAPAGPTPASRGPRPGRRWPRRWSRAWATTSPTQSSTSSAPSSSETCLTGLKVLLVGGWGVSRLANTFRDNFLTGIVISNGHCKPMFKHA